jgi:glycosyltransferase involved in cell wall biosynthesis
MAAYAADVLREHDDIHFLIIGDGVRRTHLENLVDDLKLSNMTLLSRQPRKAMAGFLATANVCFMPLASSKLQDAVPSKLLEA